MELSMRNWVWAAICMANVFFASGCGLLKTTSPSQAATPPAEEADAGAILLRMADFLAGAGSYSVTIDSEYDVVQESGEKIEFAERRTIIIQRPDHFRVDVEQSDGNRQLVVYDGGAITAYSAARNVYATTTKPGGVDAAIKFFVKDLNMRFPLAVLLTSSLPGDLERRTQTLDYVERVTAFGAPTHHLAGRMEAVDYQIWIAEGEQPLPVRIVLTYKEEEGQPQFRARFSDWNLAPEIDHSLFTFTPSAGTHKISFLAQVPPKAGAADATGEQP